MKCRKALIRALGSSAQSLNHSWYEKFTPPFRICLERKLGSELSARLVSCKPVTKLVDYSSYMYGAYGH